MAPTPKRPLGKNQLLILRTLQEKRHNGEWYPGCGWFWENRATTERMLDSLVNRGLVKREERQYQTKTAGARVSRTWLHYTITDAGRAVDTTGAS